MCIRDISTTETTAPSKIQEIQAIANENPALCKYLEDEKDFEAHFLSLATEIKQNEASRTNQALMITAVIAIGIGVVISYFTAQRLVKPVRYAYESQERFMQDAAHELRNPLAAMTAALQQVQQSKKKTDSSALITTFERQTKRLIAINEDLIYLERSPHSDIDNINISELLEDVIEELQPMATAKNITLTVNSKKDTTKKMATDDYLRLTKNIIENAVKYSPKNSEIFISQKKVKDNIVLIVKDNGIGIPSDELGKINDRFFRASNTSTEPGTGLGLAIVQKIINVYGGSLDIQSKVKKGSTFTVSLPA